MRPRLSYANVMSTLCFFLLLGGGAYAAAQLGKNSVGNKQLKKSAVTTAKVKNEAITAAKVKSGTLTGAQINASTLGTVPVANLANSLTPPEAVHLVGGAGEPSFQNKWQNASGGSPPNFNPVGFYKDHDGVVHLQGLAVGGEEGKVIFQLPPGFRPGPGKLVPVPALCTGLPCVGNATQPLIIYGSNISGEGAVIPSAGDGVDLEGVTFRAES